jgi:hypothetical protein
MIIEVKQKHIREGEPTKPCNCAIARAVKDALGIDSEAGYGDSDYVVITDTVEVYFKRELAMHFELPAKGKKIIAAYDDKGKKSVKPTTLRLTDRIR